ncbi:GPI-anchored cell wall beta-1,3-endoglucanase EglC [Xylaria bambusicola]|uniref:GPI-anchored cell wall beta-1,3-endoglucanase EglC n=1 Tax=Xylaria bambusicola TaxID=326684 RepID=UPI00200857AA|nr:GPI-anchored cell wall beta-1,3-endoglucanase EglC [Xylaria bambusicola]KAI0523797.1 GPI-anchored cell wall beta-1,3-endoglucanase EglC [Xylaria bambusicola]
MQIKSLSIALAALATPSIAGIVQGFSYGSMNTDGSCRRYDDFKYLFERARNLHGASGFTAARLYTSIQCGTSADYIEAYKAAIDTNTTILVGLWASAGRHVFENELNALIGASRALKDDFTKRVVGISVGSEDLYRSSPQGVINGEGPGCTADEIEGYIGWLRDWLKGTDLEHIPVTHVDTWTAWVLPEASKVVKAVDFLCHNSFPYFEDARPNAIEKAADNFWSAVSATEGAAQGKDVWITETGWPDTGPVRRDAVPSLDNAKTYWNTIGCSLFGKRSTFWYTLVDGAKTTADLSFAITPSTDESPKYNLACS